MTAEELKQFIAPADQQCGKPSNPPENHCTRPKGHTGKHAAPSFQLGDSAVWAVWE